MSETIWPDSYLIPGIEPYHVEDAGIIYCADCRDILPHLPKVDLVLKKSLINKTISDTITSEKGGCCNGQRETTGRGQTKNGSGQESVGVSPGRDIVAISGTELVASKDSRILSSITDGDEQSLKTPGHQTSKQGEKGEFKRQIQRWLKEYPLSVDDSERQMLEMFCNGTAGNSPQERRPPGQPFGESGSFVQQLSYQPTQETLVGYEKILILTDPPYGINADKGTGGYGSSKHSVKKYNGGWDKQTPPQEIFNMLLSMRCGLIVFGGNYFADKLPVSKCWHVWDKVGQHNFKNPYSDVELIYTNFNGVCKKYTVIQMGFIAEDKERFHPTQKPLKLVKKLIGLTESNIILDPFLGSGTTAVAAKELGRKFIGIEISEEYCKIAVKRLRQGVLNFG